MTIKEAIIKSLEELKKPSNYKEVYQKIIDNNYYSFDKGKTPEATISSQLWYFIKENDTRVKRVKNYKGRGYLYYLSKYEKNFDLDDNINLQKTLTINNNYHERDLHILLSTYLNSKNILSKTIFHEKSNSSDSHQKWIHPDMLGIEFITLQTKSTNLLLKALNIKDIFKLSSYELKKEISNDYELKKSYFQAVSNSSWANYGYLVAFEINSSLLDEMERLNESFGIGIIELKANPFKSKILFPAKYKELDYKTIDKLSKVNKDFEKFMLSIEKILTADEKYLNSSKKEFETFCDNFLNTDSEIEKYCKEKDIPIEDDI